MKQFFITLIASCLGVCLALFGIIGIFILIGIGAAAGTKASVQGNSVLKISLDETPPEHTNNVQAGPVELRQKDILGVRDIIMQIRRAAEDNHIKGIFLDASELSLGPANASAIHAELKAFKDSGKFVLAYSNYFPQGSYYLASAADTIMLNPIGSVDFRGFAAFVPFLKDLMDMTGMKMQVYYAGDFKSASEPFRRRDMSPENRLQTREYLDAAYAQFIADIAEARNMTPQRLTEISDDLLAKDAQDALRLGLVDMIAYEDEATAWLRDKLGLEDDEKPNFISLHKYYQTDPGEVSGQDRIAVVYAEGTILHGDTEYGTIGDERYVDMLSKIRSDDRIKAVVLRINSPGGNILGAENILREIRLLQEAGKPVVASMSDYAASGGYYIACTADSIFAEPNTLTGSIGVITIIPNPHAVLSDKLGIGFDTVRTGRYSAAFSPFFEWSDGEDTYFQSRTDGYYQLFLENVSEGRDMTVDEVHEVGQGRIWIGDKALELGLVDRLGNLDDAIGAAASLAETEAYRISEYPRVPDPLTRLITQLSGQDIDAAANAYIESKLSKDIPHYTEMKELLSSKEPLARLPVFIEY